MSITEISHRSKPFESIINDAVARVKRLLGVGDEFTVLFIQGGASLQFAMVPMNLLRGKAGDEVTLFDGCGAEFTARITRTGRSVVELVVLARHEICRELTTALTLGVALPKGDRQRWLIEKAVELGVMCLVPLLTKRGVAEPGPTALARLSRYVIEASKQCGRNRLLEIAAPLRFDEYCRQVDPAACRLLADVGADAVPLARLPSFDASRGVWLAVGPEGGFTDEEIAAAADWRRVSLGPRVLRIEPAAVALVAFFSLRDR